jgi:hypothetical protein
MNLHESVAHTRKEMTIKESPGFRLRLQKHEVLSPTGLFSINLINETISVDGTVQEASTYNFFMTKEEIAALAYGLTL